jgi:hypothetical protein
MNRPELYQKSIDTLVTAYHADELKHKDCRCCAVGNIVKEDAYKLGVSNGIWSLKFCTIETASAPFFFGMRRGASRQLYAKEGEFVVTTYQGIAQVTTIDHYGKHIYYQGLVETKKKEIAEAELLISRSGYTQRELADIESAFESSDTGKEDEDSMFNGLMAVVDALDRIHENTDTAATSAQKKRFLQPA